MKTSKLTLSAPASVIAEAKRIAARNKTSVSAMFTRLLTAVSRVAENDRIPIGPVTHSASGIVSLPLATKEELLADALEDKYGKQR